MKIEWEKIDNFRNVLRSVEKLRKETYQFVDILGLGKFSTNTSLQAPSYASPKLSPTD